MRDGIPSGLIERKGANGVPHDGIFGPVYVFDVVLVVFVRSYDLRQVISDDATRWICDRG